MKDFWVKPTFIYFQNFWVEAELFISDYVYVILFTFAFLYIIISIIFYWFKSTLLCIYFEFVTPMQENDVKYKAKNWRFSL